MSTKKSISGPYRATKLWNDAVRSFYNGMPVSRHWRGLRQYDRCFTATEAVDWLHTHLTHDPNFGSSVTREQTIKLLRKFVKSGLIEDVRGVCVKPEDFKEGRDLYRFSNRSPLKALRTPKTPNRAALATISINNNKDEGASPVLKRRFYNSVRESTRGKYKVSSVHVGENAVNEKRAEEGALQECHLVAKQLTKDQIDNVWKQVYLKKLDSACEHLLYAPSSSLLPPSSVCGAIVHHNATQVSQRGVVRLGDHHHDNLPSWVLTAMRCMAQWPNIADLSCNIPNYPGVERDVFKIVQDFFTNMVTPLIPFELYDPLIRIYIGAEFLDIAYRSPNPRPDHSSSTNEDANGREEEGEAEFEDGDSVEDLMLNMSLGGQQKTSTPNVESETIGKRNGELCRNREADFARQGELCRKGEREFTRQGELCQMREADFVRQGEFCQNREGDFVRQGESGHTREGNFMRQGSARAQSTPQTPSLSRNVALNASKLQSLKLRRLKNYTDFKDDSLYPGVRDGGAESSLFTSPQDNQENVRPQSRASCEVGVTRQPETVRSIKTNDQVRRMKRESEGKTQTEAGKLKIEGFESHTLPRNCCYETAFTSDSPKTRIIPQKSVDSLHMRRSEGRPVKFDPDKPRPKSIAVAPLSTCNPRGSLQDTPSNVSTVSDLFKSSIMSTSTGAVGENSLEKSVYVTAVDKPPGALNLSQYITTLDHSPMNRSRSAGNLETLGQERASPVPCITSSERNLNEIAPPRSLASRIRDSIKRKQIKDDLLSKKRSSNNSNNKVHRNQTLDHLRTRSGGYMNLALAPASSPQEDLESLDSRFSDIRYDASHMRTKSGGFLNLALAPSSDSMDSGHFTSRSDSAVLDNPQRSESQGSGEPARCSSAMFLECAGRSHRVFEHPAQPESVYAHPTRTDRIFEHPKPSECVFQNPVQSERIFVHPEKSTSVCTHPEKSIFAHPVQSIHPSSRNTKFESAGMENQLRSISPLDFPHPDANQRMSVPDGCLSHSMSSSGYSVYHSAISQSPTHMDIQQAVDSHPDNRVDAQCSSVGQSGVRIDSHSSAVSQPEPQPPFVSHPHAVSQPSQCQQSIHPSTSQPHSHSELTGNPRPIHPVSGMGGIFVARTAVNHHSIMPPHSLPPPPRSPHPYTRRAPSHPHLSPSKRIIGRKWQTREQRFFGSKACVPGLLTREGREAALSSLQLLLLLLPPPLRRSLHLLLRMSAKMAANPTLQLDPNMTTRAMVLSTFARSILLSSQESDYDEILCLRIVSFLMDNHDFILRPPEDLSIRVHRTLAQVERQQVVYASANDGLTLTYCRQVTKGDYERQKLTGSQQFLSELLGQIVENEKITDKERKKKLKEFKSLYPDVYKSRFPCDPAKREGKMKGLMKLASLTSLGRNKAIRM